VSGLLPYLVAMPAAALGAFLSAWWSRAYFKADSWSEGYYQGVSDTYTAVDANMPGYGPARLNPYLDWRTRKVITGKEMWQAWRGERRLKRSQRRMSKPKSDRG
jgi:hypothetical protein